MRYLITGSRGSIGEALFDELKAEGHDVEGFDIVNSPAHDVRDLEELDLACEELRPRVIFHLAGAKHAGSGETNPEETVDININGTANVLAVARGARVVTASTCKAADPETVYGATKLIAERMTLNRGHSVARFYNVRETSGNVFEIWGKLPANAPLPVTRCRRFFITVADAVKLLRACVDLPAGLYTVDPGDASWMIDEATNYGRPTTPIEPRRGDRIDEPRKARCEKLEIVGDGLLRVLGPNDMTWER